MRYIKVIEGLSLLLNTKNLGRGKKGFKIKDEFKNYLVILKNDFKQEISTDFLFNLMKENHSLNNRQKRVKIYNLTKGLNKVKQSLYLRGLEVMKYYTDIIEYGTLKKGLVYSEKCELSEDEQEQLKQIAEIKNKGFELVKRAENNFNERQRRQNAFNGGKVFIKNVRSEQIGKEFVCSSRKRFNFIKA